jgi:hypothetical protein
MRNIFLATALLVLSASAISVERLVEHKVCFKTSLLSLTLSLQLSLQHMNSEFM